MGLNIDIPSEAERALRGAWGDELNRAALEALAAEGYRSGKLTSYEVGQILGLENRWAVEKWLADRKIPRDYTIDDFNADMAALDRVLGKIDG